MASVTDFLARRLKLTVNAAKSAVDRPSARAFLSFSFTAGPTPQRVVSPKALARFKVRVRGTDASHKARQLHPSRGGVVPLPRWVAGLFRTLRGPLCPAPPRPVDPAAASRRRLDVLEVWAHPLRGSAPPQRQQDPGGQDREQCPWPLAGQPKPGALYRAAQRLLRPARPRIRRRRPCRLTPSNRRVRTRTHGGVGGAEPRGSPLSRFRSGPSGDCRGRPCGKPLRASRKAGPTSTAGRAVPGAALRCRGEPVQQIRSHTGPRSRRAGSVHVPRFRLLLPDSRGCRQGRRARTDVLTERSWGRSPGAQPAPIPRDRPRLGGGVPFHVATGVPFLVAISTQVAG